LGKTGANGGRHESGGDPRASQDTLPPESGDAGSTHESGDGAPVAAGDQVPEVLLRGSTVGRYLVVERIGAGAMGVVYAAYDPELDRRIALKLLRPREGSETATAAHARRQARLVRESKAIARVSHPNVVGIFDVGVHGHQVFMAMEHLAGGTLRDWLDARKQSHKGNWREIIQMFIQVGRGLAGAHAEGLIHRDFKPDNVLLDKNGAPKVVDFGLVRLSASTAEATSNDPVEDPPPATPPPVRASARSESSELTRTGALMGTPAYMAPEQFRGQTNDARTDQFAFCVALYEALYGERPFPGNNVVALADAVTSGRLNAAPKGAEVPGWVRTCVVRGLRTNADERYPNIDSLLAALANDPAKRLRKWMLFGATPLLVLAAVGLTHRMGSRQGPSCTGGGAHLAGIWEPGAGASDRKAAIQRAFAASGKSYAEQAYAGVARLFDQFAGRWTGMYAEACEATHVRGEQSEEVLDLRMSCLKERLGNARALSDVFATADGKVVENAVSAAAALPSIDRCADVALLRAVVKPPEDAATRKRVDDLRVDLANLIALGNSGQCSRATPLASRLIADARAMGYEPLLADALYAAAQLGSNYCSDDALMLQRFKEAHTTGSASHNDDVAAQAAAIIPVFEINRLGDAAAAREWFGVARGAVERLGHETLANAMLAQSEGALSLTNHDYARALAAADRSIDITRRLLGPDDPLTIAWLANKGDWQVAAGRLEDSLRTDVLARQQFERVLGPGHPRVGLVLINEGEVLNLLQRYREAELTTERAVQLFRESGTDTGALAWALTGLGHARLGLQKPAAAVSPLEEALAKRTQKQVSPALLGETRFALAQALWPQVPDRARAIALATSARADRAGDKQAVEEIDAWLSRARSRPGRDSGSRSNGSPKRGTDND
jgi:tRNA A-37 threonylcarbamoyl transferase component Bud32